MIAEYEIYGTNGEVLIEVSKEECKESFISFFMEFGLCMDDGEPIMLTSTGIEEAYTYLEEAVEFGVVDELNERFADQHNETLSLEDWEKLLMQMEQIKDEEFVEVHYNY